jgi:tRNA pseudouridine55 synthase
LEKIEDVLRVFTGDISQIPPMHSAVHVAGKRLYEYAREGVVVARAPRPVHIFKLEIIGLEGRQLVLAVTCSKGTYIRVLASDIGSALGCGAYLSGLRRTTVGEFKVEQSATPDELAALGVDAARKRLLPVEALVSGLPRAELDSGAEIRFGHGQAIEGAGFAAQDPVAVFGPGGRFLGVGLPDGERIAPLRLLAEAVKSPDFA